MVHICELNMDQGVWLHFPVLDRLSSSWVLLDLRKREVSLNRLYTPVLLEFLMGSGCDMLGELTLLGCYEHGTRLDLTTWLLYRLSLVQCLRDLNLSRYPHLRSLSLQLFFFFDSR